MPKTILFDRPLYGGGATFAQLVEPLFPAGAVAQNINPQRIVSNLPDEAKKQVAFLWGLGLTHNVRSWPLPCEHITVLREPVARFFSIVYALRTIQPRGAFWESQLLDDCENMATFVNRYLERRDTYGRSQFAELLSYMDYSGLEWFNAPKEYAENNAFEELSSADIIGAMDAKYGSILILEYQEESLFRFADEQRLDTARISLASPLIQRHPHPLRKWHEADVDAGTMARIHYLLRKETEIYDHYKTQFLQSLSGQLLREPAYHLLKSHSLRINPKLKADFLLRGHRYTPAEFFTANQQAGGIRFTASLDGAKQQAVVVTGRECFSNYVASRPFVMWRATADNVAFCRDVLPDSTLGLLGYVETDTERRASSADIRIVRTDELAALMKHGAIVTCYVNSLAETLKEVVQATTSCDYELVVVY